MPLPTSQVKDRNGSSATFEEEEKEEGFRCHRRGFVGTGRMDGMTTSSFFPSLGGTGTIQIKVEIPMSYIPPRVLVVV